MTRVRRWWDKVLEIKGMLGAGAFLLASLAALGAAAKWPAKVSAHIAQADSAVTGQRMVVRKLDVLICLEAKLDTPIGCVARGNR